MSVPFFTLGNWFASFACADDIADRWSSCCIGLLIFVLILLLILVLVL